LGPAMTKEQELEALKNQARHLEQALDDLRNRISEVESSAEGSVTT
jgi:predicted  nucleic acid-binding Zn-ribbon protein